MHICTSLKALLEHYIKGTSIFSQKNYMLICIRYRLWVHLRVHTCIQCWNPFHHWWAQKLRQAQLKISLKNKLKNQVQGGKGLRKKTMVFDLEIPFFPLIWLEIHAHIDLKRPQHITSTTISNQNRLKKDMTCKRIEKLIKIKEVNSLTRKCCVKWVGKNEDTTSMMYRRWKDN